MNFKLQSLKVKDVDGIEHVQVTVLTQSGMTLSTLLPVKKVPALDTLEIDVSREVKKDLREELKQLELRDESQPPSSRDSGSPKP